MAYLNIFLLITIYFTLGCSDSTTSKDSIEDSIASNFIVKLKIYDEENKQNSTCTGTLISSQIVLTAAHCIEKVRLRKSDPSVNRKVIVSFESMPNSKSLVSVDRVIVHQDYINCILCEEWIRNKYNINDIALLKLARPAPAEYFPINIGFGIAEAGVEAYIAGYGCRNKDNDRIANCPDGNSLQIKKTKINDVNIAEGSILIHASPNATETLLTGGDSGGPLFVKENNQYKQIGISHTSGSKESIFVYLDSYSAWIIKNIAFLEIN